MARFIMWALAGLAFLHAPLHAQGNSSNKGFDRNASQKNSIEHFWSFANCAARTDEARALGLLSHIEWSEEDNAQSAKFAIGKTRCLGPLISTTALRFQPDLFHGALAAYFLTGKYSDGNVPDFSNTPYQFDADYIARFTEQDQRLRALLLHVSECAFRNAPQPSIAFLQSQPLTPEEGNAIGALMPYISGCLELGDDDKITLSKTALRSYLSQAGYAVALAHSQEAKQSLLAPE